jgi:hypothetical protein
MPRWVEVVVVASLVVVVALAIAVEYAVRHAVPMLRQRVVASLEERFRSPVELDSLQISVINGLQVTGQGLRILNLNANERDEAYPAGLPPMLSVKSFQFRTGVRQLLEPVMRVNEVEVQGMQLNIPPKDQRGPLLPEQKRRLGRPRISIAVDKIVCSDMTLTIETDKPGKQPLVFEIRDLTLHDVGPKRPMVFNAQLVNAKPVGDIHSTGHFGPWHDEEPRDTPIDGDYSFTHADLGPIKGIAGILSSTGRYGGTLGEIGVTGTTDTPDFSLDTAQHPVDLKTEFNATVDGTTGDTVLNSVHATLLHTVLDVKGMVIRSSDAKQAAGVGVGTDVPGHYIDLTVVSDHARVEDILTLGAKTMPPLMRGAMTLQARLKIPPGKESVSKKMQVQGKFAIRDVTLTNPKWQETVNKLSMRAQGEMKEAQTGDAPAVQSQVGGEFQLANAVLNIHALKYEMPGAQVDLAGKYSLDGKKFDFAGTARTQATASQMLTGWKSILAMPFDKVLKKDGAGVEVPITISGTESAPKFGVDLGKLGAQVFSHHKKPDADSAPQHP